MIGGWEKGTQGAGDEEGEGKRLNLASTFRHTYKERKGTIKHYRLRAPTHRFYADSPCVSIYLSVALVSSRSRICIGYSGECGPIVAEEAQGLGGSPSGPRLLVSQDHGLLSSCVSAISLKVASWAQLQAV